MTERSERERAEMAALAGATMFPLERAKVTECGLFDDSRKMARFHAGILADLGLGHLSVSDQPHYFGSDYPDVPPSNLHGLKVAGVDAAEVDRGAKVPFVPHGGVEDRR